MQMELDGRSKEEIIGLFRADAGRAEKANRRQATRASTIFVAKSYEQVSKHEIMSRIRDEKIIKPISSFVVPMVVEEVPVVEPDKPYEYLVELPKNMKINEDEYEYASPMFLPTKCETESDFVESSSAPKKPVNRSNVRFPPIKAVIYVSDPEDMHQPRDSSASKLTQNCLQFDSEFECGNLHKVEAIIHKVAVFGAVEEYNLYVKPDPRQTHNGRKAVSKSTGHWFFFCVQNTRRGGKYKFNICNLSASAGIALYEKGMKPVMISEKAYKFQETTGWRRVGDSVSCNRNDTKDTNDVTNASNDKSEPIEESYTLSFTVTLEHQKDNVYFAYAIPYTYTQLQNMIYLLFHNPVCKPHLQVETVCRSTAGNKVDLLVITEKGEKFKQNPTDNGSKSVAGSISERVSRSVVGSISESTSGNSSNLMRKSILGVAASDTVSSGVRKSVVGSISEHADNNNNSNSINNNNMNNKDSTIVDAFLTAAADGDTESGSEEEASAAKVLQKIQQRLEKEMAAMEMKKHLKNCKEIIFIAARVHPADTASSWMLEGVLKFLLGGSETAIALRKNYIFYVLPMLNPDGVIRGHSRTDGNGCDLSRVWSNPKELLHPAIFHAKRLVTELQAEQTERISVVGFLELRGHHSREGVCFRSIMPQQSLSLPANKSNNSNSSGGAKLSVTSLDLQKKRDPRSLYFAAAKRSKLVSLRSCSLIQHVAQHSRSSVVVLSVEHKVPLSVRVFASMFRGPNSLREQQQNKLHFLPVDYARFGCELCMSLADMFEIRNSDTIKPASPQHKPNHSFFAASFINNNNNNSSTSNSTTASFSNNSILDIISQLANTEIAGDAPFESAINNTPADTNTIAYHQEKARKLKQRRTMAMKSMRASLLHNGKENNNSIIATTVVDTLSGAQQVSFSIGSSDRLAKQLAKSVTFDATPAAEGTEVPLQKTTSGTTELSDEAHTMTDVLTADEMNDTFDMPEIQPQVVYAPSMDALTQDHHYYSDEEIVVAEDTARTDANVDFNEAVWERNSDVSDCEPDAEEEQEEKKESVTVLSAVNGQSITNEAIAALLAPTRVLGIDLSSEIPPKNQPIEFDDSRPVTVGNPAGTRPVADNNTLVDSITASPSGSPARPKTPKMKYQTPGSARFPPRRLKTPEVEMAVAPLLTIDDVEMQFMTGGHGLNHFLAADVNDGNTNRSSMIRPHTTNSVFFAEGDSRYDPFEESASVSGIRTGTDNGVITVQFTRKNNGNNTLLGKALGTPKGEVHFTVDTQGNRHRVTPRSQNTATLPIVSFGEEDFSQQLLSNSGPGSPRSKDKPDLAATLDNPPHIRPKTATESDYHFYRQLSARNKDIYTGRATATSAATTGTATTTGDNNNTLKVPVNAEHIAVTKPLTPRTGTPKEHKHRLKSSILYDLGPRTWKRAVLAIDTDDIFDSPQHMIFTDGTTGDTRPHSPVHVHSADIQLHSRAGGDGMFGTSPTARKNSIDRSGAEPILGPDGYHILMPVLPSNNNRRVSASHSLNHNAKLFKYLTSATTPGKSATSGVEEQPSLALSEEDSVDTVRRLNSSRSHHDNSMHHVPNRRFDSKKELQSQFLFEMGLDYDYIVNSGAVGTRAAAGGFTLENETESVDLHPHHPSVRSNHIGEHSKAFPIRKTLYDDSISIDPSEVTVTGGRRGVNRITPFDQLEPVIQHKLLTYYSHVETSLKERGLVDPEMTEITAQRIFGIVNTIRLQKEEHFRAVHVANAIQQHPVQSTTTINHSSNHHNNTAQQTRHGGEAVVGCRDEEIARVKHLYATHITKARGVNTARFTQFDKTYKGIYSPEGLDAATLAALNTISNGAGTTFNGTAAAATHETIKRQNALERFHKVIFSGTDHRNLNGTSPHNRRSPSPSGNRRSPNTSKSPPKNRVGGRNSPTTAGTSGSEGVRVFGEEWNWLTVSPVVPPGGPNNFIPDIESADSDLQVSPPSSPPKDIIMDGNEKKAPNSANNTHIFPRVANFADSSSSVLETSHVVHNSVLSGHNSSQSIKLDLSHFATASLALSDQQHSKTDNIHSIFTSPGSETTTAITAQQQQSPSSKYSSKPRLPLHAPVKVNYTTPTKQTQQQQQAQETRALVSPRPADVTLFAGRPLPPKTTTTTAELKIVLPSEKKKSTQSPIKKLKQFSIIYNHGQLPQKPPAVSPQNGSQLSPQQAAHTGVITVHSNENKKLRFSADLDAADRYRKYEGRVIFPYDLCNTSGAHQSAATATTTGTSTNTTPVKQNNSGNSSRNNSSHNIPGSIPMADFFSGSSQSSEDRAATINKYMDAYVQRKLSGGGVNTTVTSEANTAITGTTTPTTPVQPIATAKNNNNNNTTSNVTSASSRPSSAHHRYSPGSVYSPQLTFADDYPISTADLRSPPLTPYRPVSRPGSSGFKRPHGLQ